MFLVMDDSFMPVIYIAIMALEESPITSIMQGLMMIILIKRYCLVMKQNIITELLLMFFLLNLPY
ncbi:hypothetical protein GA0061070_100731 [Kosakonia oryziphila]|uniref:Uncharacterized protein n=1 Tax=Kosakonia oryziphila TaxID=1005667 RepID=A0A1C4B8N3_9ENTR|nr:hypothetical protein GA0061070_100731 [Kosakonia oryziphila]